MNIYPTNSVQDFHARRLSASVLAPGLHSGSLIDHSTPSVNSHFLLRPLSSRCSATALQRPDFGAVVVPSGSGITTWKKDSYYVDKRVAE